MLSESRMHLRPFESSLLDGIDIRETIRNWHQQKIYVREYQKISGSVGSIVLIFDEDLKNENYPYQTTWLGEHASESDMAFYSTPLTENVIGPGISRCHYGGFMLTYPPMRMYDIWNDPDYIRQTYSKSELLLMAAIDYALEKYIVYVAAKPFRPWFHNFAAQLDRKLIYLPIGQLNPVILKKIRTFHILDGKGRRPQARNYIY